MKCKICNEEKSEKHFYMLEDKLDDCCSACRANERQKQRAIKRKRNKNKPAKERTTTYVREDKKKSCPKCNKTDAVGFVVSTVSQKNSNVAHRYYCRECLIEFDCNGRVYPPLY